MQIEARHDLGHLSYCTNIHAGESWADVRTSLAMHLPAIKAASAPDRAFGIGLRLAARAVESLQDPAMLEDFKDFLGSGDYYVFTINGFPYGAFHGQTVKENVYAPDWSKPERLTYTNALADLLVNLLPQDQFGSISTVPGTFKPWVDGRTEVIADRLVDHVAHLVGLERRTGRTIALALEPEPCCMLETIAETVAFFNDQLFSRRAVDRLAEISGLRRGEAEQALRRHVGVCYDVCHAAVEYEDPAASIAVLRAAGIAIPKLQLSSALRIAEVTSRTADDLHPFDEPVYLHQVIERRGDELRRFTDLPEAFSRAAESSGSEWRIHFHVPVFLDQLKDFGTTQFFLREILSLHAAEPIAPHLEVETYTWDVLPDEYRNVGISTAISRELDWVMGRLLA